MPDPQCSLLPFDSPQNLLLHLHHEVTRLTRLQEDLTPRDVILLLADLAVFATLVDTVECRLRAAAEQKARRFGLIS